VRMGGLSVERRLGWKVMTIGLLVKIVGSELGARDVEMIKFVGFSLLSRYDGGIDGDTDDIW
jgi:hypothetical protein